jgi:hypothetical protein
VDVICIIMAQSLVQWQACEFWDVEPSSFNTIKLVSITCIIHTWSAYSLLSLPTNSMH